MEKKGNIIRLDLDLETQHECLCLLKSRLAYLHDVGYLNADTLLEIELVRKSTYGALITLKKDISVDMIFNIQLMLGSDYKKEACAQINYYKYGMKYYDRLFSIKRYPDNTYKVARYIDVTKEVTSFILDHVRKKNRF